MTPGTQMTLIGKVRTQCRGLIATYDLKEKAGVHVLVIASGGKYEPPDLDAAMAALGWVRAPAAVKPDGRTYQEQQADVIRDIGGG